MTDVTLLHGDCLELMPTLPAQSVQMVFADLPYGYKVNNWDHQIPLASFLSKTEHALVRTAKQIFTCDFRLAVNLYNAMPSKFRYDLIWKKKGRPSGHLNANRCPLRSHETILVFGKSTATYNAQMVEGAPYNHEGYSSPHANGKNFREYAQKAIANIGTRFPQSILEIDRISGKQAHPTQKPVALLEWLIKTYTNPGDTVLDPVAGSFTTAIACLRTGRKCIAIEKDADYFALGKARVEAERARMVQASLAI